MKMVPKLLPAFVLGGAGALALGYPAAAAPVSTSAPPINKTHPAPSTITPRTIGVFPVFSADLNAPSQQQTRASVLCPKGTVVYGGGSFVSSSSPLAGLNDSFPSGNGWVIDVNNTSGDDTDITAIAMCGPKPAHYKIVKAKAVKNPSGRHTVATAKCPTGSKPLGGGAAASSNGLFTNLGATLPQGQAWRSDENNASASGNMLTAFAVCGQVHGYHVVVGPATNLPANDQTFTAAECPSNLVAIGGGGFASTSSVGVNLNETAPASDQEWKSFINNVSGVDFTGSSIAVCAAPPVID
jgi:hypothetical protein